MKNIRRPAKYEETFRLLSERSQQHGNRPIFVTQRDLLCFCAILGVHVGARSKLSGESQELDGRVFDSHGPSLDIVYLIALTESRDATILASEHEDEMVAIFEEYAATGLQTLNEWIAQTPADIYGVDAILNGLVKHGFLKSSTVSVEKVIQDVTF